MGRHQSEPNLWKTWRFGLVEGVTAEVILMDGPPTRQVLDHLSEFLVLTAKGQPEDRAAARAMEVREADNGSKILPSQPMLRSPIEQGGEAWRPTGDFDAADAGRDIEAGAPSEVRSEA